LISSDDQDVELIADLTELIALEQVAADDFSEDFADDFADGLTNDGENVDRITRCLLTCGGGGKLPATQTGHFHRPLGITDNGGSRQNG
jgi:hypothetical protein